MDVVRKAGDEHRVDQRGRRDTRSGLPLRNAPPPRSAVNSSLRVGIVDRRDLRHAVDLERERRAEDRQAVREVRRAVDRIEHPARSGRRGRRAAHFLGEHLVIGKALGDQRAEHPLDGDVDLGHEIDRPLLVDLEVAAELRHLQIAGADDRLDRRW